MEAGTPIAVCSTSNERAVSTIVRVLLGPEVAAKMRVYAGDVVPKKKPAPDIYLLAAKELGVDPRMCAARPSLHVCVPLYVGFVYQKLDLVFPRLQCFAACSEVSWRI